MRRLLAALLLCFAGSALAAPAPSATLQGLAGPLLAVPMHLLPVDQLEQRIHDLRAAHPQLDGLFAVSRKAKLDLSHGHWEPLNNGDWVWRMRVASPGAVSLVLHFANSFLPLGSALRVLADGQLQRGPFTQPDFMRGSLWTATIPGDHALLELVVPAGEQENAQLQLASIGHGWRQMNEPALVTKAGLDCYTDVVCPEGDAYRPQIRSVVLIQFEKGLGIFRCTATLLNNTSGDGTPYLLTANHCINTNAQANSLVAYWNFQKPQCDGGSGSLNQVSQGATLRAHYQGTDFSLVELRQPPDAAFQAYYAGWSRTDSAQAPVAGIHHPKGTEKRISITSAPPQLTQLPCTGASCPTPGGGLLGLTPGAVGVPGSAWRVQWQGQPTDEGSSGSGLFTQTGLLIGQLSRGNSSCDTPNGQDFYGTIRLDWNGGGSQANSLKAWLDPLGSNPTRIAGMDANSGARGRELRAVGGGCTLGVGGNSGLQYLLLLALCGVWWRRQRS